MQTPVERKTGAGAGGKENVHIFGLLDRHGDYHTSAHALGKNPRLAHV